MTIMREMVPRGAHRSCVTAKADVTKLWVGGVLSVRRTFCAGATRGEELAALVVELAQQRVVPAAERHGG